MTTGTRDSAGTSFDLVLFLWARRKLILWITLLGFVIGVVASFVIRNQYKSEVILFPAVTNSVSKALLNEQSTGRDDILALGDEEDAEQLLQMIQSDRIRDSIAKKYDLASAYRIEPDDPYRRTKLAEAYDDHITSEYTKFGSVRVEVLDEDPARAMNIANDIAAQVDTAWTAMGRERAVKGLKLVAASVHELEAAIQVIGDSLKVLRGLGVQEYRTQAERYNEYLGLAIVKGDQRAIKEFEQRFKVLAENGGAYVTLQDEQYNAADQLGTLRMKLAQAQADVDSDLPHKFVVNRAQQADKKSYPVRWLITVMCTVSAFLFSLVLIVVQENVKKIRATDAR